MSLIAETRTGMTSDERKAFFAMLRTLNIQDYKAYLKERTGKDSTKELDEHEISDIIKALEAATANISSSHTTETTKKYSSDDLEAIIKGNSQKAEEKTEKKQPKKQPEKQLSALTNEVYQEIYLLADQLAENIQDEDLQARLLGKVHALNETEDLSPEELDYLAETINRLENESNFWQSEAKKRQEKANIYISFRESIFSLVEKIAQGKPTRTIKGQFSRAGYDLHPPKITLLDENEVPEKYKTYSLNYSLADEAFLNDFRQYLAGLEAITIEDILKGLNKLRNASVLIDKTKAKNDLREAQNKLDEETRKILELEQQEIAAKNNTKPKKVTASDIKTASPKAEIKGLALVQDETFKIKQG
jgi:hypothetical protein